MLFVGKKKGDAPKPDAKGKDKGFPAKDDIKAGPPKAKASEKAPPPDDAPPDAPSGGDESLVPDLLAGLGGANAAGTGDPSMGAPSMGKLHKAMVIYMGSEHGPFQCDHCVHFPGDGSCDIVDGDIDHAGKCNLFESKGAGDPQEMDMGAELEGAPQGEGASGAPVLA